MVQSSAFHLDVLHESPDDFHKARRVSLILKGLQQEIQVQTQERLTELLMKQVGMSKCARCRRISLDFLHWHHAFSHLIIHSTGTQLDFNAEISTIPGFLCYFPIEYTQQLSYADAWLDQAGKTILGRPQRGGVVAEELTVEADFGCLGGLLDSAVSLAAVAAVLLTLQVAWETSPAHLCSNSILIDRHLEACYNASLGASKNLSKPAWLKVTQLAAASLLKTLQNGYLDRLLVS